MWDTNTRQISVYSLRKAPSLLAPMQTAFFTIELPLPSNPTDIHATIEAHLKTHGTPLRWSITEIKTHSESRETQRIALIEAIVTTD